MTHLKTDEELEKKVEEIFSHYSKFLSQDQLEDLKHRLMYEIVKGAFRRH